MSSDETPPEPSGLARRFARALVKFYYPEIEVTGGELIPRSGPVLLVANHPNSLIDPVLLGLAAQRPVRLMAKAPLFDLPVFGAVLRALGMVPAYRGSDDAKSVTKNLESLNLAARRLAMGGVMGIFPEGKSHDAVQVALVRSGAARLALQTVAACADTGPEQVRVVPVGLNYERKERFRTAVWIKVGRPIDAGRWLRMHDGDEHRAMRTLTQEIAGRLRSCVVHLDNAAWEPLLTDIEALLPPPPRGRAGALATLHQRKRVADAINLFHRADPERATVAARRVAAHATALRQAGLPTDARMLARRGAALIFALGRDGLWMLLAGCVGLIGLLYHAVPYGIVRVTAGRLAGPGRMIVALSRLLLSVPIYAAWYAFLWWRMSLYFMPWVAWTWLVLAPCAGLVALAATRRLRTAALFWWAELRLLTRREAAAKLRAEHEAIGRMLENFAAEAKLPKRPPPPSAVYRAPSWLGRAGWFAAALSLLAAGWLLRDRAIEVRRPGSPPLHEMRAAELTQRVAADERALAALIAGLQDLEARFGKFQSGFEAGERSYYRPEDDDEIRRMLVSYLSFRTALLRMSWYYQWYQRIGDERTRLRALLLHYTAAALAYDYTARFVEAFEGPEAMRKLNEAEPRWDLPAGTYDAMRANLAHAAHRRWLETSWQKYHATLPRWAEHGLRDAEPHMTLHRAIARAGENTAALSEKLLRYKVQTALADVKNATTGGVYAASASVSTFLAGVKIREPRGEAGLVTPALAQTLRAKLQPGDIVIERRNWYLSTAFLPGYWPHAALYVGTAADLRALGLEHDPRVAKHLARFAQPDASGELPALIEAVSAGVIFTTYEYSVGHADSVAVLRPRLEPAQIKEAIARAFSHAEKPYDFEYDFFSADKLVCTELVYRAFGSFIEFPLVEMLGRKTLPALDIVRYAASPEGAGKLEFVAFLDGDERAGTCVERDAEALKASISRPALTWLQPETPQ